MWGRGMVVGGPALNGMWGRVCEEAQPYQGCGVGRSGGPALNGMWGSRGLVLGGPARDVGV